MPQETKPIVILIESSDVWRYDVRLSGWFRKVEREIMRRIKGIVRTVVAIAGAISLNSHMMVMVAAGSGQGFTSELKGLEDGSCKIGNPQNAVHHPVTVRGQIGKFERKKAGVDSRRG